MANDEAPKPAPADASASAMNKAQAEFQRYMKRMQGQQPGGAPVFMMPVGFHPGGENIPGWAVPPSVAMMPQGPGASGFFAAMPQGGAGGEGSLTHSLGSTIRLGVDVINAALAGSVRLLNGMSGMAYGHPEPGCGCNACSGGSGTDCCGCEECCNPGVGTCC